MIKTNELRVGSLVSRFGNIQKLELSDFYGMEGAGHNMDGASKTDTKLDGIRLTDDVLKHCKLDKKEFSWFSVSDLDEDIDWHDYSFGNYIWCNAMEYTVCVVQYLHQLQNFYLLATGGIELEIDPEIFKTNLPVGMPITSEIKKFANYLKDFYGKEGICEDFFLPEGASDEEITNAIKPYIDWAVKNNRWGGDSFDREIVRDIMFWNRGEKEGLEHQKIVKEITNS